MKICVVGMGNMGMLIYGSLRAKFDVVACCHGDDPNEKLAACDAFIIAVKPQSFADFARSVNIDLSGKLAVSIMAGVTIEKIQEKLKMKKVARTIPNLPLKIGQGFTVWKCSAEVVAEEKNFVREILQNFGEEMEVAEEEQIVTIGAMSACGPAYFFYIAEQVKKSALNHGFSQEEAEMIARATFVGSANYLKNEGLPPEVLREKVTSKGGSTEAAFKYLESQKFGVIFLEGIEAAIKRTRELNG